MSPTVSIVIPAFEEARRLPETIEGLYQWVCNDVAYPVEVIVVVESSSDRSLQIARDATSRFLTTNHRWIVMDSGPQRGKGWAVRKGMLAATGEILFYMDADLSVPLREVNAFVHHLNTSPGTDVLIGNRQHAKSRITRAQGFLRRSMGQMFNRLLATLALTGFADTQCGFKAFRRDAARQIFSAQRLDGFAFDVEVLLLARRLGLRVEDHPVEWSNSVESKVHIVQDSLRMLRDAVRVRAMVYERARRQ